jgi:stage V sporulation protein R
VLRYLHAIWGRPVHIQTVLDDQPCVLSFDGQENTRRAA